MKKQIAIVIISLFIGGCENANSIQPQQFSSTDTLANELLRYSNFISQNHIVSTRHDASVMAVEMQRNRILQDAVNKNIPIIINGK